jgi:flagellin
MGLRIRTNVQSLISQRHLGLSTGEIQRSSERLSSGYRINRSGDDAAGSAISTVLSGDIRSLTQARRNANDGISLIETAEGGLNEITNIMVRLRELSVQAASDTIGVRERQYLNQEFFLLKDEIDRIALSTEFNGTRLLIGPESGIPEELLRTHNSSPLEIQVGKDYFIQNDAITQHNPIDIIRIDTSRIKALTDGEGGLGLGQSVDEDGARIDSKKEAQLSIAKIDVALEKVAGYRADLGAIQNRLEKTDKNLSIFIESLTGARSRILDVDFASETANMTQQTIMQQAGASVLAQANTQPQIALKLLSA